MKILSLILAASALVLTGAGCDLSKKIEWRLPFSLEKALPVGNPAAATAGIALEPGLAFTVRPSSLGLTGTIDEALGNDANAVRVTVTSVEVGRTAVSWEGSSASGTLSFASDADAHAMLLPAFWPSGAAESGSNGGLWFSGEAYAELRDAGATEWRLGLAENAFSTLSKAFATFNDIASRLSGSATATVATSPFTVKKTGIVEAYPLNVDGRIVLVRAVKATSWFAEFLILENEKNPLILKVTVNPVAAPALRALEPAAVRWEELGYEITAISRP